MYNVRIKEILVGVGIIMLLPGIMALISIPVAIIMDESCAVTGFLYVLVPSLTIGFVAFKNQPIIKYHLIEIMIIITLGWLVVTLTGSIPLLYIAHYHSTDANITKEVMDFKEFINAWFESVSGFTSTGLTMAERESQLTSTIQWWRSFMQWVGGIGVIVAINFIYNPKLYTTESFYEDDDTSRVVPSANKNFFHFWWIYLLLTFFSITLFLASGLNYWEAINHGLSGIATGGFVITDNSFQEYGIFPKSAAIVIMILGSLSLAAYHRVLTKKDIKSFFKNNQIRLFFISLVVGYLILIALMDFNPWVDSLFQFTSALGTCGFQSAKIPGWPLAVFSSGKRILTCKNFLPGILGFTRGNLMNNMEWHIFFS